MIGTSSTSVIMAILLAVTLVPNFDSQISTFEDNHKFGGQFTLTHIDSEGYIISQQKVDNLVTNEGMECVSDLIFNGTASCASEKTFSYIAVGTSATAPANGDTALGTESGTCARVGDATVALDTATTGQRTATVSVTFSGANCEGQAFVETGVFDSSTSGNMLARSTFSSITLSSGDSLQIDYDIVINNT